MSRSCKAVVLPSLHSLGFVRVLAESSAKQRHGLESSSDLIVNVPVENFAACRGKMTIEPCFRRRRDPQRQARFVNVCGK